MHRSVLVLVAALTCIASPVFAQRATKPAVAATVVSTETINLNTATAAQIATLPGIGEKTAERIIEYREKNGGFKKVEDLMNVKGIGEKSFLKLKALITVGDLKPAARH